MKLTIQEALQNGVQAHKAGKIKEADQYYTAILNAQPKHPDANHNMGVLAVGINKIKQALPFFKTAIDSNPNIEQFWLSYINALIKLSRFTEARDLLDQAKSRGFKSDNFYKIEQLIKEEVIKAINQTSLIENETKENFASGNLEKNTLVEDLPKQELETLTNLYRQKQFGHLLDKVSVLELRYPNSFFLNNISGASHTALGHLNEAIKAYRKVISLKPDSADAYYNLGNVLKNNGELEEALDSYKRALILKPNFVDTYYNMGNAFKEEGKFKEALDSYKRALSLNPNYAGAYNNMGIILQEQGKFEEALDSYKRALSINPNYAEAYNNMGIALQEQGKFEEALDYFKRALSINPNYAEAYNNMGIAHKEQGKFEEALDYFKRALSLNPNYAEAYNNMGIALQEQGKFEEAIKIYNRALSLNKNFTEILNNIGIAFYKCGNFEEALNAFKKAISQKPDSLNTLINISKSLRNFEFKKTDKIMEKVIISFLDQNNIVRPNLIISPVISYVKLELDLLHLLKSLLNDDDTLLLKETILKLSNSSLLLKFMSISSIPDLEIEHLLSKLRKGILLSFKKLEGSKEILPFQSALALQCFTNEYIFLENYNEINALKELEISVTSLLENGDQPSPNAILCLASYQSLNQYEWKDKIRANQHIKEVLKRQIIEPNYEKSLKGGIPILEEITNRTSSKVRNQYESNPYPRWVNTGTSIPYSVFKVASQMKLQLFDDVIKTVEAPDILVAGCGTGQHSLNTRSRFKNSKVIAVDLSLSSLAYAKRKTEELNVSDIEYMQCDILDLEKLQRKFDIIESVGVLHHMDNPMSGWKVLTRCLKKGGLMRIGLYSELARQDIIKMHEEIKKGGVDTCNWDMKAFRNNLLDSKEKHHMQIKYRSSFYSLSEFRDLLFHVCENRFTIPQIKDYLSQLGLRFCGFEEMEIVEGFMKLYTKKSDIYNLSKWDLYEREHPKTFRGMYQFWCQKIS